MRYILLIFMLYIGGNAFSQQPASSAPQVDAAWIKSWGEAASSTAKSIEQTSAKILELHNEVELLRTATRNKELAERLIARKQEMIARLTQKNIDLARVLEKIIEIQRKGITEK